MDEAASFDGLVAMDGGRVLSSGTPAELLQRTGPASGLASSLPCCPRRGAREHQIPSRCTAAAGARPAGDRGIDLSKRFGAFLRWIR